MGLPEDIEYKLDFKKIILSFFNGPLKFISNPFWMVTNPHLLTLNEPAISGCIVDWVDVKLDLTTDQ